MGKYRILVDSSTKSKEGKYMVGPSTAAWLTYLNKRILCYGLIYFDYNGPNKAFYEGIIAALVQLDRDHFNPAGVDEIEVFGDCTPVIDQINNKRRVKKMKRHLDYVKKFINQHPNVQFKFSYLNEDNKHYKKVDKMTKEGSLCINKIIDKN